MKPEISRQTKAQAFMLCLLDPERADWRFRLLQNEVVEPPTNPNLQPHFHHDAVAIAQATAEQRETYRKLLAEANSAINQS